MIIINYLCYALLCVFVVSCLFTIGCLIYEINRKQYVEDATGIVYYYHQSYTYNDMVYTVLQSSENGRYFLVDQNTLNEEFRLRK